MPSSKSHSLALKRATLAWYYFADPETDALTEPSSEGWRRLKDLAESLPDKVPISAENLNSIAGLLGKASPLCGIPTVTNLFGLVNSLVEELGALTGAVVDRALQQRVWKAVWDDPEARVHELFPDGREVIKSNWKSVNFWLREGSNATDEARANMDVVSQGLSEELLKIGQALRVGASLLHPIQQLELCRTASELLEHIRLTYRTEMLAPVSLSTTKHVLLLSPETIRNARAFVLWHVRGFRAPDVVRLFPDFDRRDDADNQIRSTLTMFSQSVFGKPERITRLKQVAPSEALQRLFLGQRVLFKPGFVKEVLETTFKDMGREFPPRNK